MKTLKTFQFTYEAVQYGGGIAIVVAYNRSEAQLLLTKDWEFEDWKFDSEIEGVSAVGDPRVITSYTYAE